MAVKTIGLLGGMSWESSAQYYRIINETVKRRLGGLHSAQCLMFSVDFAGIEELQRADRWDEAGEQLADGARRLQSGGAELLVLCTNTMHRVADEIAAASDLPFLHIADATADRITAQGIESVGLLGTRYTMEQDFYRGRLSDRHGLRVLVPDEPDRTFVHDVIYDELVLGKVQATSRRSYREIIARLVGRGAEAIILGCTEIGLLVDESDATVPLFDTTVIHAERAVELALT
jgi:aspartate racemase